MKKIITIFNFIVLFLLSGCACIDPFEPVNRKIFNFNMIVDHVVFRPVARLYERIVPCPVERSIGNFFDNIDDLTNIANNTLQFRFYDAWSDVWRVAFNTTFGLLGLFDVATCAGLEKHHQDFGLTLARYGFVRSWYLMIPFFGPSTLRDTIGWTVDWNYLSIWPYLEPRTRYTLYGIRLVHKRACFLAADKLIDESLDPYIFVRDAYLQKRDCDIKNLFPCCDGKTSDTVAVDGGDTFVAEDGKQDTHVSSDDTFVPAEDTPAPSHAQAPSSSGDTFVAP